MHPHPTPSRDGTELSPPPPCYVCCGDCMIDQSIFFCLNLFSCFFALVFLFLLKPSSLPCAFLFHAKVNSHGWAKTSTRPLVELDRVDSSNAHAAYSLGLWGKNGVRTLWGHASYQSTVLVLSARLIGIEHKKGAVCQSHRFQFVFLVNTLLPTK